MNVVAAESLTARRRRAGTMLHKSSSLGLLPSLGSTLLTIPQLAPRNSARLRGLPPLAVSCCAPLFFNITLNRNSHLQFSTTRHGPLDPTSRSPEQRLRAMMIEEEALIMALQLVRTQITMVLLKRKKMRERLAAVRKHRRPCFGRSESLSTSTSPIAGETHLERCRRDLHKAVSDARIGPQQLNVAKHSWWWFEWQCAAQPGGQELARLSGNLRYFSRHGVSFAGLPHKPQRELLLQTIFSRLDSHARGIPLEAHQRAKHACIEPAAAVVSRLVALVVARDEWTKPSGSRDAKVLLF